MKGEIMGNGLIRKALFVAGVATLWCGTYKYCKNELNDGRELSQKIAAAAKNNPELGMAHYELGKIYNLTEDQFESATKAMLKKPAKADSILQAVKKLSKAR